MSISIFITYYSALYYSRNYVTNLNYAFLCIILIANTLFIVFWAKTYYSLVVKSTIKEKIEVN